MNFITKDRIKKWGVKKGKKNGDNVFDFNFYLGILKKLLNELEIL